MISKALVTVLLGLAVGCSGSSGSGPDAATADAATTDAAPAAGADASVDAGVRPGKDFVCNQVTGLQATGQWYAAGFEMDGVDDAHWQAKTQHLAYIEKWADPNHPVWNQAITSPCANGSDNPDRVVFVGFSPPSMTEAVWEASLIADITTIKAKYPAVQEIDVMSMVRAPGNQLCPGNTDPLVMIAPYVDQAIAAAVARFPGLAKVGPQIYAPNCDAFVANDTDLVPVGAAAVAKMVASYFAP